MIQIQIKGGTLDIYDEEVSITFHNLRFGGLRDPFSNDFSIPKTENNLNLLGLGDVLNSVNINLTQRIEPATLNIGDSLYDVFLQVVAINDSDISICVFEKFFPDWFEGKTLNKIVSDTNNTIYEWNRNSKVFYPNVFINYSPTDKGYSSEHLQLHPSRPFNAVLGDVNNAYSDFTLPYVDDDIYVVSARKTVCPQNTKQMMMFIGDNEVGHTTNIPVIGGQHITNDLSWEGEDIHNGQETIVFNRDCNLTINEAWFSYKKSGNPIVEGDFFVDVYINGTTQLRFTGYYDVASKMIKVAVNHTFTINEGDELKAKALTTAGYLEMVNITLDCDITDYEITYDDYDTELIYHPDCAFVMNVNYNNNVEKQELNGGYFYFYTHTLTTIYSISFQTTRRAISYFGFWSNLPELTMKEVYEALCWQTNQFIRRGYRCLEWSSPTISKQIAEFSLQETRTTSDVVGRKNYILYNDEEALQPDFSINNSWLDDEVTIYQSVIQYATTNNNRLLYFWQYDYTHKTEVDDNGNRIDASEATFNEVDGLVLGVIAVNNRGAKYLTTLPDMSSFDLKKLTRSIELDVETYQIINPETSFIYLDGRKYFIIDMTINYREGTTDLLVLLTQ